MNLNDTPRVDALIDGVMEQYPCVSRSAQAEYYEEVHKHLAPLARDLEREIARLRETLQGIADADWRKWEELASPHEFVRWAKARALHALTPNPRSAPRREDGPHRNAEHHLHQTGSHAMKLLKFGAPWCKPCQALDKTLESANLGIEIEKVDIDQRPECAAEYRVRSVPTLVLLDDDGAEIDRRQGALSLGALLEFIEFDDLT